MTDTIPIGKSLSIRACGYDEFWLQDQIVGNPICLQLGELDVIYRERQQASGGRLDILLKDPEDDSMYEAGLRTLPILSYGVLVPCAGGQDVSAPTGLRNVAALARQACRGLTAGGAARPGDVKEGGESVTICNRLKLPPP